MKTGFSQLPAAMECGSIMSLVWCIFNILRIIPKSGSKYINKLALIMWLMLITICTVVVLTEDIWLTGTFLKTASIISTLLSDILGPIQSVLVIITISALVDIKLDCKTRLLCPKYPLLFLLTTIL